MLAFFALKASQLDPYLGGSSIGFQEFRRFHALRSEHGDRLCLRGGELAIESLKLFGVLVGHDALVGVALPASRVGEVSTTAHECKRVNNSPSTLCRRLNGLPQLFEPIHGPPMIVACPPATTTPINASRRSRSAR
jgi:hypothetical protein